MSHQISMHFKLIWSIFDLFSVGIAKPQTTMKEFPLLEKAFIVSGFGYLEIPQA